jgi:amino acid transporter
VADTGSETQLHAFGYTQDFKRTFAKFASFAIGFSFISITTGIFTTYGSVLKTSGPVGIWTWPLVIIGQLAVALIFGALASRMPLAGYSYQWTSRLANPHIGWFVGWILFTFLVVDVVAVDYALASTVLPALLGYTSDNTTALIGTVVIILVQGLLIMLSTVWSERINNTAVAAELIGVGGLTILLIVVGAATGVLNFGNLTSTGAVPTEGWFSLGTATGASPFQLAFLLGAFTIVGFEACSNLAEETHDAETTVPRAMWTSVLLSGVVGMLFLIAITVAGGDMVALSKSATPVADVVDAVLGSVIGKLFLVVVTFAIFACGLVIFISASRLTWAMARDERFPGWRFLGSVHRSRGTPLVATLLVMVLLEVLVVLFSQATDVLFSLFSTATLLPAIIYAITVLLYIVKRRSLPKEHGFSLGRWEPLVIVVAVVWLVFELSIFRDAQFSTPWLYIVVMTAVGVVYYVWMRGTGRKLAMPSSDAPLDPAKAVAPEPANAAGA